MKKLKPQCIAGTMQAAVTNRGHLIPCCWLDDKNNLNHPIMKSLLKVSKISEVDDIEQIVFTKEWIEFEKNLKERNFDIFDIKNDVLRTLNEVGVANSKITVSNKTKKWYHPGRSGLLSLGSASGPELAYFGEIHPFIINKLDLRTDNVLGFEIILDNIPESRKKIREAKPQFIVSDYQKVVRDFAFVIDEKYSSGEIISLVKKIDNELIKDVRIFDVYQGDNIAAGKKSIAFNVTLEPKDKTLSDNDIEEVSKKIISTVQETTGATLRS